MTKTEIQTIIRETIYETLVQQQDDASRSACKTYSQLMNDANTKLEEFQRKNDATRKEILDKLDTHLEHYQRDREASRVNNEAIFDKIRDLTEEIKKNSDFRVANGESLEVIKDALTTIKTNKKWLLFVASFIGAFVVVKEFFKH